MTRLTCLTRGWASRFPDPAARGSRHSIKPWPIPAVLERMNLPGLCALRNQSASLMGSPSKIGVLIDSSQGYFSPKMRLLQAELAGKHRTILFRDPAGQRDHFVRVLGNHSGRVSLWNVPLEVETRLFTDPQFVQAVQASLFLFRPEWPLVYATRETSARRIRRGDRGLSQVPVR